VGKPKLRVIERDPGLLKQYPRNKKVDVKIHGCLAPSNAVIKKQLPAMDIAKYNKYVTREVPEGE
jgi:hypothetical protein